MIILFMKINLNISPGLFEISNYESQQNILNTRPLKYVVEYINLSRKLINININKFSCNINK